MTDTERKLGRYELLRRIASGGMGEIYLARARGAGGFEKLVIIKTILPHLAEQQEFVTKFLDEGRIVVQLTHGNIVPVFDMGEENGEYFIAMEYVPGLDLRAVLKRRRNDDEPLAVEHVLYITSEICKGLGYAHRKCDDQGNSLGIVHRDVSPSNVLISHEGEVKIIDFGIARAADKVAQTLTGHIQGKCCYMSPEQARGKSLDARSDIFSTGVLLYEMLTLQRPFEGRSDLESLDLVRECNFDPPSVLRPSIPDDVDAIIERAMARDPQDRYPVIDEMFVDLQDQIYQLGRPVTSQQLVEALGDIFADTGQSGGGNDAKTVPGPTNLDEALELELARLEESSTGQSSPNSPLGLAATATSAGTQTLSSTPPVADPRPESESNAEPPDSTPITGESQPTPHLGAQAVNGHTPSQSTGPTPSTNPGTNPGTDPGSPNVNTSEMVVPAVRRRHLVVTVIALVTVIAGATTAYIWSSPADGTLELATDPPGAQLYLNGDEMAGQRTPLSLDLAPDIYEIELVLDDHRPRSFNVNLSPGEVVRLSEEDLQLYPAHDPVREYAITTDPDDAELIADGEPLGSSPQTIALHADEVVNLSARSPDCSTIYYALSYGHERQDIHLELECRAGESESESDSDHSDDDEDDDILLAQRRADAVPSGTASDGDSRRPIRIDTDPAGADITVNDDSIGDSPLYVELHPERRSTLKVHHPGYEPYRRELRAGELEDDRLSIELTPRPRGCLDFRAVYPAHNEIAINDRWLDGRHMALQNHELPAGEHTITVRHPESDREETFQVTIDAGSECKVLTVWEPE